MESVYIISPFSPIKYNSISEFCLVWNSEITCLHEPHGATGFSLILSIDPATIAIALILISGYVEFA